MSENNNTLNNNNNNNNNSSSSSNLNSKNSDLVNVGVNSLTSQSEILIRKQLYTKVHLLIDNINDEQVRSKFQKRFNEIKKEFQKKN